MSIPVIAAIAELRTSLAKHRGLRKIALAPTMGALHAGHGRLIEMARQQAEVVVVSIFVNPLQFDRREDFERYARTLPTDVAFAEQHGADLIFAPLVEEMYPAGGRTFVEVEGLTRHFCGASRPGHFRGVTTVVAKLFHIVAPDLAFFGEKDAQQLAVIRRMTRDLNMPVEIVPVPTVREPDGLAMSSRNARLNPEERKAAICLYRALCAAQHLIARGERDTVCILEVAHRELERAHVSIDYIGLANPETMCPVEQVNGPVRAMGAVWLGETRLIDNLLCSPPA